MKDNLVILRLIAILALLPALAVLGGGCKSKGGGGQTAATGPSNTTQTVRMQQEEAAVGGLLAGQSLKGKVVLVAFGRIDCPLSGEGLDEMISLHKSGSIAGLNFLRVETAGDDQAVDAYYRKKAPPFAVYRDKGGKLAESAGATVTPTFMLVDKFGHIRYRGSFPQERLDEWAAALLAEKTDPKTDFIPLGAKDLNYAKLMGQTTLNSLDGKSQGLAGMAGKGGLLIFFGDTTCPYSEQALGEFPAVAAALGKYGIPAVVINIDDQEKAVRNYYQTHKPGLPVLFDPTSSTSGSWNIQSVPTLVFVRADGKAGYYGKAVWADLGLAVEDALGLARGSVKFTAEGTKYG
ncbi:MAG: TlpA family protein disulfide reductase [Planctomycetes bacterium]|nr:TlpA family protein disulfide reductase [Planctomycetota bacterium]